MNDFTNLNAFLWITISERKLVYQLQEIGHILVLIVDDMLRQQIFCYSLSLCSESLRSLSMILRFILVQYSSVKNCVLSVIVYNLLFQDSRNVLFLDQKDHFRSKYIKYFSLLKYIVIHILWILYILFTFILIGTTKLQKLEEIPQTKIFKHSFKLEDKEIYIFILKMNGSNFIWIGSDSFLLKNMAISMQTPFQPDPTSIQLFGNFKEFGNSFSQTISKLCTKQTGNQWVASFNATNIPHEDRQLKRLILEELKILIKAKPEWFD